MALLGLRKCALSSIVSWVIWRRAAMSRTQRLRPCVAATTSPAVGWIANSWTATVGRLLLIRVHEAPRLVDAYTENSVPRYSKLELNVSSRNTRVEPTAGRLARSDFHVWPKSSVT